METHDLKSKSSGILKFNSKLSSHEVNGRSSGPSKEILNPRSDELKINNKVFVNGQNPGIIKFLGETSFAPGIWSGIELVEKNGKNDGSVNGVRYFTCESNYGIFVRPYRLTLEPLVPDPPSLQPDVTECCYKNSTSHIGKTMTNGVGSNLKVGDRVLVNASSGLKKGILRYLGSTDFSAGKWAGIELTEATGKNDGAVGGKRYFTCPVNYGLFAPLSKVTKDVAGSRLLATRKPSIPVTNLSYHFKNGGKGSQESLASNTSTASRRSNRIKLGITALDSKPKSISRTDSNLTSPLTSALQKTLQEKEFQISQLLKERDYETSELAKANSRAKACEDQLFALKNEHQKLAHEKEHEVEDLKRALDDSNDMVKTLKAQNEEEKRKVEILEFRLEEELMNKMEMKEEMERLIDNQKSVHKEEDNEMELFQLQEEIIKKDEKIIQLESMLDKKKLEVQNLLARIKELETKVSFFDQRREKQLETIDDLNLKLKKREDDYERCNEELSRKNEQINKLQKNMSELLKRSGDDSGQLNMLVDKLRRAEDEKAKVEGELQRAKHEMKEEEECKERFEQEIKRLKQVIEEQESQNVSLLSKEKQLTEDLTRKEETLKKLNNQIIQISQKSGSSDESLKNLTQELRAKEKEYDQLNEKLIKVTQDMKEIEFEKRELVGKNEQLQSSLEHKNDQVSSLQNRIDEMSEEIRSESAERKALDEQVREMVKNAADGNTHLINLNEDLIKKQKEINDLQDSLNFLKMQLHKSDVEKRKYQSEMEEAKKVEADASAALERLEKSKSELAKEKDDLWSEVKELKVKNHGLEEERVKLKKEIFNNKSGIDEKDEIVKKLRDQIETSSQEFDEFRKKLNKEMTRLRENFEASSKEMKEELRVMESENRSLKMSNSDYKFKVEKLTLDLDNADSKHTQTKTEFELEMKLLKDELEEKKSALEKVKLENISVVDSSKREAEEERLDLLNTISQLKNTISEASASQLINQTSIQDYEGQIDFLNSVIVDMQEKIDSLKVKVRVYEEIGLSDFDVSPNPAVKPANGYLPKPPRVFCDICDAFDSHETDDCPLQINQVQEAATHSRFNAKRNEERPYCTKCEMFGHLSDNCENECF